MALNAMKLQKNSTSPSNKIQYHIKVETDFERNLLTFVAGKLKRHPRLEGL